MLYARLYREIPHTKRSKSEKNPEDIPNLVAEILTSEVERRLRRSLSLELKHRRADLTRVRGRIDHLRTERRYLLQQGKVACLFDEFIVDTPKNQFVRAALNRLTQSVKDNDLNRRCRASAASLERAGVSATSFSAQHDKASVVAGRINAEDRRMLAAAELAFDLRLPTEEYGDSNLPTPDRSDKHWMRKLFERAVGGFYTATLEHQGWEVWTGKKIDWQAENGSSGIREILPGMEEDIVLDGPSTSDRKKTRIIIDTKFTSILKESRYSQYRDSLKSHNIYQIYTYLRSQEHEGDPPSLTSSGVLLYPSIGKDVDESVTIQKHRIRFATVNLAADSSYIRDRLRSLILDGNWS